MVKRTVVIALTVVLLLVPPALAQTKTRITWMEWPRPHQDELNELIIASFNEKYPDIEVVYQPMTSEQQVPVAMAAGTAPDVIGYWGDVLIAWMEQGAFLALDDYLNEYGFEWDDFNPMQLEAFSWEGKQYILPHYLGTTALFYNVDIFQQAGIPFPDETWDWTERREAAKKLTLTQDGQTIRWGSMLPVTSIDRWANLISANGGRHHPEGDNSIVLWDQPEAIEAMEYWRAMLHDDRTAPTIPELLNSDYRATFASGVIAMYETLPIDIAHYEHAPFTFRMTQVPKGPVKRVPLATLDGFGVWAGTPNPDAAVKFLLHLVSPEVNEMRARLQSLQPARRSVLAEWVDITLEAFPFVTREDIMQFYYAGETAEPMPSFADPTFTNRTLASGLARIYTNNEPPAIVMGEIVPVINARLRQLKEQQ